MRTIQISTDVFAAIWAARREGEPTEDAILHRIFKLTPHPNANRDLHVTVGFHDPRYGVTLDPGFEIFRTYLGKEYRARAIQGFWNLSSTGVSYPTLNELSNAIGAKKENAWGAWFYLDNGKKRPVSDLREASKILHRTRMVG